MADHHWLHHSEHKQRKDENKRNKIGSQNEEMGQIQLNL